MTNYDKIDELIAFGDNATQGELDYSVSYPDGDPIQEIHAKDAKGEYTYIGECEMVCDALFFTACANARDDIKAMRDENKALKERVADLEKTEVKWYNWETLA